MQGVLIVDKPIGPTSHDVVRVVRRALRTREVGHAGTLDPMASGVLVVGVGEGTKLLHHLTAEDKTYVATLALGVETDTLDAQGRVVASADVPSDLTQERVEAAMREFMGETTQRAPAVSAIKQGGVALHERVRRGEEVVPPERTVYVHELQLLDLRARELDLRVRCGKGFYVRALARDLAAKLGTLGHLSMLRRVASGGFAVEEAVSFPLVERARDDAAALDELRSRMLAPAAALRGVPQVGVNEQGVIDVSHGRALVSERLASGEWPADGVEPVAVIDPGGELIALGRTNAGRIEVMRGIHPTPR